MTIGSILKDCRAKTGMSVKELGEKAGYDRSIIYKLEKHEYKTCALPIAADLLQAMDAVILFDGAPDPYDVINAKMAMEGTTVIRLSAAAGLSKDTIEGIRKRRHECRLDTLLRVAECLAIEVTIEYNKRD